MITAKGLCKNESERKGKKSSEAERQLSRKLRQKCLFECGIMHNSYG